jgi:hypothetical protein
MDDFFELLGNVSISAFSFSALLDTGLLKEEEPERLN